MANKTVSLVRICKTENGWRRFPVIMSANGRIKPNTVKVDGVEMEFPEGRFQLRQYIGKQPRYKSLGTNAADALKALLKAQRIADVTAEAAVAGIKIVEESSRKRLQAELKQFRNSTIDRGSPVAEDVYRLACDDFLAHCGKEFVDEVTKEDITKWHGAMRRRGLSDRTVYNRNSSLKSFLKHLGMEKIAPRSPRFEKTLPEIYSEDEMEQFFAALQDSYQTVVFSILLMCGLRMKEAMHLEWTDIDWKRKVVRIQSKPRWKFKVKDKEERDVPIPARLLTLLKAWQKTRHETVPNHRLIIGTAGDKPNRKLLRTLKRAVYSVKMHCGKCDGCIRFHECDNWFLHKFRATYITRLLRAGIDLRTVMSLSGHSDLASVMRYLRPAEGASLQGRIDSVFG